MKTRLKRFKGLVFVSFVCGVVFGGCCAAADKPPVDNRERLKHPPKNVIILIADGGGFNHIKAADYYQCGQIPCQVYEDFPVQLAMSTYEAGGRYDANAAWASFDYVRSGATDSAAAATAMATGVKTYNSGIGVDVNGNPVMNLLERAEQSGKATGVVSSVPFSHATPAAFVAHNISRNNFAQISLEMVYQSAIDVIMGCGHPLYDADGKPKKPSNYQYVGTATWARLIRGIPGSDADGDGVPDLWQMVQTREEFQALTDSNTPKRVIGVAQVFETLQEYRSGNALAAPYQVPLTDSVPTLEEMTCAALNVLDDDPDGLFVMIEGGAVDWAAHDSHSGRFVEEMIDFNRSVEAVISWVNGNSNWGDTLVIVTADHETGYLTGAGSGQQRTGPVWNELTNNGVASLPTMEWHGKSHTNSLVPFFAKGRGAKLFKETIDGTDPVRGPYIDNTDVANVILALWSGSLSAP